MSTFSKAEAYNKLLWLDLETTGLGQVSRIIEIAVIMTDAALVEHKRFSFVINDAAAGAFWEPGAIRMHTKNGLVDEMCGPDAVTFSAALTQINNEVVGWAKPRHVILAGRSVHFDRQALIQQGGAGVELMQYLNHQHLDMSAIEIFLRNAGLVTDGESKPSARHRAIADLEYAIEQYRSFQGLVKKGSV